jgi:glycosyltransferase involved in cell wall biosynthesis
MICIVAYYFGPKLGVGNFIENLLPKLLEESSSSILLICNQNVLDSLTLPENRTYRIVNSKFLNNGAISALFYMFFVLPFILLRHKVRVLFLPCNPVVGFYINCKIISVIHDINEYEIKNKYGVLKTIFRKKIYIQRSLKLSHKVVVISNYVKNQIQRHLNISQEVLRKIVVIHNGVRVEETPTSKLGNYENYFLYVGRIDPNSKNLAFMRDFFLKIITFPQFADYKLLLVGGINSSSSGEAVKFLEETKTLTSVEYLGFVADDYLMDLYSNAKALLLMSKHEGFGLPLMEAYGRGCNVIRHSENAAFNEIAGGLDFSVSDDCEINLSFVQNLYDFLLKEKDLKAHARKYSWNVTSQKYIEEINSLIVS